MISSRNVIYLGSSRYRRLIITDLSPLRIGLCRNLCPRLQLPLRQHVFCLVAGFFFYPTIFFLHRQGEYGGKQHKKPAPAQRLLCGGGSYLQRYFGKPPCFYFALSAWL